jgi:hypothetical protein
MNSQRQFEKLVDFSFFLFPTPQSKVLQMLHSVAHRTGEELPCIPLAALCLFILQLQLFWAVLAGNRFLQNTR